MSHWHSLFERAGHRWIALQPGERRTLVMGAALLAVALVYFLGIDPALAKRRKLDIELPKLRSELLQVRRLAEEARQIPRRTASIPEGTALVGMLKTEISQARLTGETPLIKPDGPGRVQITLAAVDADNLWAWLEQIQKRHGLRVVTARLTRTEAGQVRAEMMLDSSAR